MAAPSGNTVLVEQWFTVLWRSTANWVAVLGFWAPEAAAWALSHLDSVPPELLSPENKNIARAAIIMVGVPLARIWKQRALRRAVAKQAGAQKQSTAR